MRWCASVLVMCVLLSGSACGPKNPNLSPKGQVAATADAVLKRIGEFQNTVISLGTSGQIATADAREIVAWISGDNKASPPRKGVVDLIEASPSGWKAVLKAGWPTIRPLVAKYGPLMPWLTYIDTAVEGV